MFVPPPASIPAETGGATGVAPPAATRPVAANIDTNNISNRVSESSTADEGVETNAPPKENNVDGWGPNPLFTSNRLSPLCMDPGRVTLYRSFGFIVGLAVRTGVTLPLSHLSPKWWMLVSNDVSSSVQNASATRGECSPQATTSKVAGVTKSRPICADAADSPNLSQETAPPQSAIDEVLMSFSRLEEAGLEKEEIDEILADARFVAPLSNGHVTELIPGGEDSGQKNLCHVHSTIIMLCVCIC